MDVYGNQLEWDAADADSSYRLHLSYLALQSGGDVVTEFGAAETGRGEYPQVTEVSCLCNTVEVTDITCSTYTRGSNGLKNSPRTERRNFMDNVWDSPLGTTYVLGVPQGADEVYFVEHGEPSTAPISIERYLQEVDAIVSTIPEASR